MRQKVTICIIMLLGMLVGMAEAETYTWEDSSGTLHFTEDISQVPQKYLKKVRVRDDMGVAVPAQAEDEDEFSTDTDTPPPAPAAPSASPDAKTESVKKEALYGNKSGREWKRDFDTIRANIQATDDQIDELNLRLQDTGEMRRSEYLSIHNTLKNAEFHRKELKKKLEALTDDALRAGVPEEFR